ncbi:MAG: radical SAM protein [Acidobacteria bacterium]|jgi:23S rRNA (adenine2503-C2)-methyltransferase|nr:radical SAM protein [Acidobacteriota bacterium]
MKILSVAGHPDIASVFLAELDNGKYIEFVESIQPPISRDEKWVLIVSTLYGCPVSCKICDAGGWYEGPISSHHILAQVDFLVNCYYPDLHIPCKKFKIQFARMGEPSLNPQVLDVLETLPNRYRAPGLMPSLSTVAPLGTGKFFDRLYHLKQHYYNNGRFQLQFSIHTTDMTLRDQLVPVKKWDFKTIAAYGKKFYTPGDRKITLNFALADNSPVSADILTQYFDPGFFAIKITPVNPTVSAHLNKIGSAVDTTNPQNEPPIAALLRKKGYDVIVSIGELEENKIGSNCGQYVKRFLDNRESLRESYCCDYNLK